MNKLYAGMMAGRPYFNDESLKNILRYFRKNRFETFIDYLGNEQKVPRGEYKIDDFLDRHDIKVYIREMTDNVGKQLWFRDDGVTYIGYSLFFEYLSTFNIPRYNAQKIYYDIKKYDDEIKNSCDCPSPIHHIDKIAEHLAQEVLSMRTMQKALQEQGKALPPQDQGKVLLSPKDQDKVLSPLTYKP